MILREKKASHGIIFVGLEGGLDSVMEDGPAARFFWKAGRM